MRIAVFSDNLPALEAVMETEALVYFTQEHRQKGIQVTLEHDPTASELIAFQHQVTEIKKALSQISEAYGLARERVSLKHLNGTKAAFMWEDITGAGFDRLRGHGEVDESLRGEYETFFDRLTQLTDELIIKNQL